MKSLPKMANTPSYFLIQSMHRKHAIDGVIGMIESSQRLPVEFMGGLSEIDDIVREWTIETLIQGAVLREYHYWETDTKSFFDAMHTKTKDGCAHTKWVKDNLVTFELDFPEFQNFDDIRVLVNDMKHEDVKWATMDDFKKLQDTVSAFWSRLSCEHLVPGKK